MEIEKSLLLQWRKKSKSGVLLKGEEGIKNWMEQCEKIILSLDSINSENDLLGFLGVRFLTDFSFLREDLFDLYRQCEKKLMEDDEFVEEN